MTDNKIIISGGQLQIKDYPIALVSKDYPRSESRVENWMNEFNLLVLFCDARFLREQRDMLAIIRNTMHFQNRSSEVILFLTHIDEVMNITPMDTKLQTLLGIYSAFSSEPFSTTALKDEFSDCTLDSSYWLDQQFSRYQDNNRDVHFQMPRGVICNTSHSFGYCDLLMTIIRCCLSLRHIKFNHPIGFHIQTNHNNQLKNSSMNRLNRLFGKEETIRLAVIGDTSSGKTFLLQDFCQTLSFLGFTDTNSHIFPFATHADFRSDIHKVGYGQTPTYACTQRNHYVAEYQKDGSRVRIEFLDIPGDIFKVVNNENRESHICANFIRVLSGLKSKRRDSWFKVSTWENGSQIIKVVSYIGNNKLSTTTKVESGRYSNNQSTGGFIDGNNSPASTYNDVSRVTNNQSNGGTDVNNIRMPDYLTPDEKHRNWLKENGYEENPKKTKKITGKNLIDNFFSYDAHSVYNALKNAFKRLHCPVEVDNEEEYTECLKYLYFYVFLYYATDIVFCQRCYNLVDHKDKNDISSDRGVALSDMITNLPIIYRNNNVRNPNYYLVFKGGDTFLNQTNMKSLYKSGINLNHLYSYFTQELNKYLYDGNCWTDEHCYYVPNKHYKKTISVKVNNDATIPKNQNSGVLNDAAVPDDFIRLCIGDFRQLNRDAPINKITPHTYFCTTPIDNLTFKVDSFKEGNSADAVKGTVIIDGHSMQPNRRVCFGTVQLTMDLLENHSIKFFLYNYDSKTGRGYTQPGTILRYLQKKQ